MKFFLYFLAAVSFAYTDDAIAGYGENGSSLRACCHRVRVYSLYGIERCYIAVFVYVTAFNLVNGV